MSKRKPTSVNANQGISEKFVPVYKILHEFIKDKFKDEMEPLHELVMAIEKVYRNREISIPFSQEDLEELMEGKTFNWNFEGVDVCLYQGEELK